MDGACRRNVSPVASALTHGLKLNGRIAECVFWQEGHGSDLAPGVHRPGVETTTFAEVIQLGQLMLKRDLTTADDVVLQFAHGTDLPSLCMLAEASSVVIACAAGFGREQEAVNLRRSISDVAVARRIPIVVVIAPYASPASGAIQHGLLANLLRDEPGAPDGDDAILPEPQPWLDPVLDGPGGPTVAHDDPGRLLARSSVARRLLERIAIQAAG